jgi:hypothetical protein
MWTRAHIRFAEKTKSRSNQTGLEYIVVGQGDKLSWFPARPRKASGTFKNEISRFVWRMMRSEAGSSRSKTKRIWRRLCELFFQIFHIDQLFLCSLFDKFTIENPPKLRQLIFVQLSSSVLTLQEWSSSQQDFNLFPWLSVPTTRHEYDLYRDDQCYSSFLSSYSERLLSASGWARAWSDGRHLAREGARPELMLSYQISKPGPESHPIRCSWSMGGGLFIVHDQWEGVYSLSHMDKESKKA